MWRAILENAPPVLQAVSIAVTAVFAIIGLNAWRRQLVGKRKIEVAEETLVATYKVKDAMSYIRSPGAFGDEGATRPREAGETEDLARARNSYFVPLERIQKTHSDFADFQKMRLFCQVYFGPEAIEPFDVILRERHLVAIAARMLISKTGQLGGRQTAGFS